MDVERIEETNKALVRYYDPEERLEFGSAAPYMSRDRQRARATRAPGLPYSIPYSRDSKDYPQTELVSHDLLGRVYANLATSLGETTNAQVLQRRREMAGTIGGYFERMVQGMIDVTPG